MSHRVIKKRHLSNSISSGKPNQRRAGYNLVHPIATEPKRMTLETKHRRIAATFRNQAQFEAFIAKLNPAGQDMARELIAPYLSFKLVPVAESVQVP